MNRATQAAALGLSIVATLLSQAGFGQQAKEVKYTSAADGTRQPAMFYAPPDASKPVPLLVALHTWSGGYRQRMHRPCLLWCVKEQWAFIHPHFRGPNRRPQATGSDLVVADITSAVEYARQNANIDAKRIYLVGTSGGGYTALLMAGRAPEIWAGVSAWVPISDLKAWHAECKKSRCSHFRDIEKSCGGPPGTSNAVDEQYKKRSPITYLKNATAPLDINAGIFDGHKNLRGRKGGDVPISHSLRAFNLVAQPDDRVAEKDIAYFVRNAKVPPHLAGKIEDDTYGDKQPLFRRTSGVVRMTLFDGGHELISRAAMSWLARQRK